MSSPWMWPLSRVLKEKLEVTRKTKLKEGISGREKHGRAQGKSGSLYRAVRGEK